MASYNLRTKDGRDELRRARQAELKAVRSGEWPRDLNDWMRWTAPRDVEPEVWAARMCEADMSAMLELDPR